MTVGVLPLARPTFDVDFAKEKHRGMMVALQRVGTRVLGGDCLLMDAESAEKALSNLVAANVDQILILQVTFTDAEMTAKIAQAFTGPLQIWAVNEPRDGGRLRLNAFCGLNLAAHALGLRNRSFGWLFADPDAADEGLRALLDGGREVKALPLGSVPPATPEGQQIKSELSGKSIALLGEHPAGFDTCAYDQAQVRALTGVSVEALELDALFAAGRSASSKDVVDLRGALDEIVKNAGTVDQEELDRSLRLKIGLDSLRRGGGYDAFAIRCWPETFTEYGGAVCGPAALAGEERVPCACEADVYGALTQLALSAAADAPVFLTDLVDVDVADDTAVVWHCGQAPLSMRDPDVTPEATLHTNRQKPLLFQFPLKPGVVTILRISQARGQHQMILGRAEMLKRPMAYTGTSGVLRFDREAGAVLSDIIAAGLEHHIALAYGDHTEKLRGLAGALNLPLLEL